jgi:hypothetical protein
MSDEIQSGGYDSAAEIGTTPSAVVKRWDLELSLADKAEKDWRKTSQGIVERYRVEKTKKNSFNILWSNTETLRQAVYNTLPSPDIRRRFRDPDPIGKVVAEVLERSVEFSLDAYDFDYTIKHAILDSLLPGRGVTRVKYVSYTEEMESDSTQEPVEGEEKPADERLVGERCICEHVNWEDFRRGPGKTWDEVRWVAFRHRMSRSALTDQFGKIGATIPLDNVADEEVKKADPAVGDLFKTLEVWEIWDKDDKSVSFIARSYKNAPLLTIPDPLGFEGFFPIPRCLMMIEDSGSLVPIPIYVEYREQAEELDRISTRINKLTDALKHRGVYNSMLSEFAKIEDLGDNEFASATDIQALIESGGLEKHIWVMPIEQAAKVIQVLMEQREACKQVIYEITGISDIMRSATDARETFGAQKLKSQWGTQRLKKMQAEVQRYIRDLIRMMSEVISKKFQVETMASMTGLKLAMTDAEKAQIQQAAQMAQAMQKAQQSGQPPMMQTMPPPTPEQMEMLNKPSWEQVMKLLRDDMSRMFRIDIETDSTIAASVESDMQGLSEVLKGVSEWLTAAQPMVATGALPLEAAKEVLMTITRRARLGTSVEDAFDKMQAPKPGPNPEEIKAQTALQLEQMRSQLEDRSKQSDLALEQQRMQMEAQFKEREAQNEMRVAQAEQAYQAQQDAQAQQMEHQREMQRQAFEQQNQQLQAAMDERMTQLQEQIRLQIAREKNETTLQVAEIGAQTTLDSAQISAANQAARDE